MPGIGGRGSLLRIKPLNRGGSVLGAEPCDRPGDCYLVTRASVYRRGIAQPMMKTILVFVTGILMGVWRRVIYVAGSMENLADAASAKLEACHGSKLLSRHLSLMVLV
jgi:hypothetical protein